MPAQPDPQLLQRILAFPLSAPTANVSFASKLADDNGWTLGHALQVEQEYRRFLYLTQVAGHMVCPSKDVDTAWHLHLTQTQSYQRLCSEVLREFLHHTESKGGDAELRKHQQMYKETLASYRVLFNMTPPATIWPEASQRFALSQPESKLGAAWKWPFAQEYGALWTLLLVLAAGALGFVWATGPRWPILPALSGPSFLQIYLLLLAGSVAVFELHRWLQQQGIRDVTTVDTYEAAWLCGGKRRVFSTALASLIKRGLLFTSVKRHGHGALNTFYKRVPESVDVRALPPVEQVCLSMMPERDFSRKTMAGIAGGKNDLPRHATHTANAIGRRLVNAGLVHADGKVAAPYAALILVLCALLTAAVARFVHGVQVLHPVLFLALLIVMNIALLGFYLRAPVTLTARGRKSLATLKADNRSLKRDASDSSLPLFALGFALFGVSSVSADPDFEAFQRVLGGANRGGSDGSGGAGGDGGCSGGGGGGGCGGGGCGG